MMDTDVLTQEEVGRKLSQAGLNPQVHLPRVTPTLLALELTGSGATGLRRVDPPADGQEPTDRHQVDGKTATETTVVISTTDGREITYKPHAERGKGASLNP